jgi:uncharacterized RDD family membrane protein YckC
MIVDNNSSNGTYLQKRKISQEVLQNGDDIFAGRVHIYFSNKNSSLSPGKDPGLETVDLDPTEYAETAAFQAISPNAMPPAAMEAPTPPGGMPTPMAPPAPQPSYQTPVSPPPQPAYQAPPAPQPQSGPAFPTPPQPVATPPQPMAGMQLQVPPAMASPFGQPAPMAASIEEGFASPIHRLLAVFIDWIVAMVIFIPFIIISVTGILAPMSAGYWAVYGVSLLFILLHPIVGWAKYGKTLGKHFLGLRIIMEDQPQKRGLSIKALILRMLGYMISSLLFLLPFLLVIIDSEGKGLHDKMAGTRVVKKM